MSCPNPPNWPDSVIIIDDTMDPSTIKELTEKTSDNYDPTVVNAITKEVTGSYENARHFVEDRYAVLFKPGTYKDVSLEVGYYTQVAGLGANVEEVVFTGENGSLGPYCPALRKGKNIGGCAGLSLDTFWRVAENYSTKGNQLWAVSQAAPLRRVNVQGDVLLHDNGARSSGGHMANCVVNGKVSFGSQQQFCCRSVQIKGGLTNDDLGAWSNVFVDCEGVDYKTSLEVVTNQYGTRTVAITVDNPKLTVEKPFVSIDMETGKYFLHVPKARLREEGQGPLPPDHTGENDFKRDFSNVFVPWAQTPDDTNGGTMKADLDIAAKINAALKEGKDIVLSPGMYYLSEPLVIQKDNQVILGLGLATLVAPVNGEPCIKVPPRKAGVRVAGIMLEASRLEKKRHDMVACFIEWGDKGDANDGGDPTNPGVLSDVFARVGGSNLDRSVSTDIMIRIFSGNVYGDNLWLWRADHVALIPKNKGNPNGEVPNFPPLDYHQTTLNEVPCETGLEVTGDNVTIHGLAVEHTTKDQTIWKGKNGNVQFYQCELPYDVNNSSFGEPGYLGYKVTETADGHVAAGVGVYANFRDYEVEVKTAIGYAENIAASITNPFTKLLDNNGLIKSIINGKGAPAVSKNDGPVFLS